MFPKNSKPSHISVFPDLRINNIPLFKFPEARESTGFLPFPTPSNLFKLTTGVFYDIFRLNQINITV